MCGALKLPLADGVEASLLERWEYGLRNADASAGILCLANVRADRLRQADLLTVFPCALPAGPRVEKASGILLWCIERQAVYCDLLRGVCKTSVSTKNGLQRPPNVILAMLCTGEDLIPS